ncbi:MAG: LTA synthase family protein [Gammaproteobacteria bacterium]|nr:LTA synthase family protein [Gammaproteobacteria bacterium]MBU1722429.1 LTA synthase family protein [Gammaproteobacteria bacterium]MBU2004634.1 LTA synthase family protein [Gammaproteobacteria bacterium]
MTSMKKWSGALWPFLCFALVALVILSLSRLGFMAWYSERVTASDGWGVMLLQGLRVDVATVCWLWGIPAALTLLLGGNRFPASVWLWVVRILLTVGLWLLVFMEVSTPGFITEYGLRPNHIFVEYLIYPKEVFSTLWLGHKLELLAGLLIGGAVLGFGWWLSGRCLRELSFPRWYWRPVLAVMVLLLAVLGARSTLGQRALNPAMVSFATDPTINSLVVNSTYSLMNAVGQMRDEGTDLPATYGKMPEAEMVSILREASGRPASAFVTDDLPTLSVNQASYTGKPKNVVILLQESLGARYIGSLGGLPLSPNIDRLAQQGWFFENIYATGTRSVRGIEAVTTGFTPTPNRAVVKLNKSQTGFFSIAELLGKRGYMTQFIYGGESHFDNMRSFFLGNGFQDIIEQKDYQNPVFTGSWGVSDEDLMRRADAEFKRMHAEGKPFFSLVFSSSNHDPFEYPDGRFELYEQPKATRNNAAKYADYAIGEFFKLAQQSDYWNDTVFLIIADHDSRVSGNELVPVPRFHIPGLILGGGVPVKKDARVVSQIDMPPTLLSLAGISAEYPMLGRDLTQTPDDWPGRAMMQYDKNFALLEGGNLTILQPDKPASGFSYDPVKQLSSPAVSPVGTEQARRALAYLLWGGYAYDHQLYRLP